MDLAELGFVVKTGALQQAERNLDQMTAAGGRAERSTRNVGTASDRMARQIERSLAPLRQLQGLLVAVGAGLAARHLVETARTFQILEASLRTATGSAQNAELAFQALQEFAATTPYGLEESTNAFVRLVNMGLDPSERALRSYGNTAAAMGKRLNDMIEAVADAAVGEFERLKEFGIRASSEGDRVTFTFRGVSTTVAKEAAAIEDYLRRIGEVEFAGAMAERAKTLDGALSALGDSWDQLFYTISEAGVGELIASSARRATEALDELSAGIASGELRGYLQAWVNQWDAAIRDVDDGLTALGDSYGTEMGGIRQAGLETVRFLIDAFTQFPANVTAFIRIVVVELAALVDRARAYGEALAAYLDPATWRGDRDPASELEQRLMAIDEARLGSISAILAGREQTLQTYERELELAARLREEYEKQREVGTGDRLGGFGAGGGGGDGGSDSPSQDDFERELERIEAFLMSREEREIAALERRREIVEQAREAGYISQEHEYQLLQELELAHQERLNAIRAEGYTTAQRLAAQAQQAMDKGWQASANFVLGQMTQMTAGVAQSSRAMFEINKLASLAQAALNIPEAASNAYTWASKFGGPAAGAAAAALAVAAQVAQMDAIQSTSFGGGGHAPSVAGTTPAMPVTPVSSTQQQQDAPRPVDVRLHFDSDRSLFTRQEGERMLEVINDLIKDGATIGSVRFG